MGMYMEYMCQSCSITSLKVPNRAISRCESKVPNWKCIVGYSVIYFDFNLGCFFLVFLYFFSLNFEI
jgi:hypothetical protein